MVPFYAIRLVFKPLSDPFFCKLSIHKVLSSTRKIEQYCINLRHDQETLFDFDGDLSELQLVLKRGGILEIQQLPWDVDCHFSSPRMISTRHQRLMTNGFVSIKTPIFDHRGGVIKAKALRVRADYLNNQQGTLQASNRAHFEIKTLLDNIKGVILAGDQLKIHCKGVIHNRAGRILALHENSNLFLRSDGLRNEHLAWIGARGKTQIIAPNFRSDETSRIVYAGGFGKDALLGAAIDLEVGPFYLEAPLCVKDLRIKAQGLWLFNHVRTDTGTIALRGQSFFQAARSVLGGQSDQSTITIHTPSMDAQGLWGPYGQFKIRSLKEWRFNKAIFKQDIDLDLQLLISAPLDFPYPVDLRSFVLHVDPPLYRSPERHRLSFEKSLMAERMMRIDAPFCQLKIGDLAFEDLTQLRTRKGPLILVGHGVEMPFGALCGMGPVGVYSQKAVVIGSMDHPNKVSHLRSETEISVYTQDQLRSYHLNLDVQGNFHLRAPKDWLDVGGTTFVSGTAFLNTPLNEHRIKTKIRSYLEDRTPNVTACHAVRNGRTTAVLIDGSPPVFIANRIESSGQTKMVGGPIYAATFKGAPPITETFSEAYHNDSEAKYGHRKERKAQWYWCKDDWKGRTALSSFGTYNTTFERTSIQLPGVVRASTLTLLDFKDCLIGSLGNRALQPVRAFDPVIDLMRYSRSNTALVESKTGPTLLMDRLSLNPVGPSMPRVIVSRQGLTLHTEIKPLYPWSEEKKLIVIALLSNIGQLPPDYNPASINIEALAHGLMQNTLAWMQGLRPEDKVDPLALIQTHPLVRPHKPILVYTIINNENQAGVSGPCLRPLLIMPKHYEKLYVQAKGDLLAQQLWMVGAQHAELRITHKVEGVKLLSVDVDNILLETLPEIWQQNLEQIQSTRRFLRKKKHVHVEKVLCSKVHTVATLCTEGELQLKTKHLKQIGAVIQGGSKPSNLAIGTHSALPVFEHSLKHYETKKRTLFSKAHVEGSILHTHIVPSKLGGLGPLQGEIAQSHYCALAVDADEKIDLVFKDLKFLPAVINQAIPPQIHREKGSLIIQQQSYQQAIPTAFRVEGGSLCLESTGHYHSVASHYEAPRGIKLKARQFSEEAQILVETSDQTCFGIVEGFSYNKAQTQSTRQTALVPHFCTDTNADVVIESTESASLVAPKVQAHQLKLQVMQGDATIVALPLSEQRRVYDQDVGVYLGTNPSVHSRLASSTEESTRSVGADLSVDSVLIQAQQKIILEGVSSEAEHMVLIAPELVSSGAAPACRSYQSQVRHVALGFDLREGPAQSLDFTFDDGHHSLYLPLGFALSALRRRSKPEFSLDPRFRGDDNDQRDAELCSDSTLSSDVVSAPSVIASTSPSFPRTRESSENSAAAHSTDSEGILRQSYENINAFFKESHRLMEKAEQGAPTLYQQYPELRRDAAQHAAGFAQFRAIVPQDAADLALKAVTLAGGPKVLKGTVQGMQWIYGQAKVGYNLRTFDSKAEVSHIFSRTNGRPKHGHVPDTPENRKLLVETFSNPKYFKGVDAHGKAWFRRTLPDQREAWVVKQNGRVKSGGINPPGP